MQALAWSTCITATFVFASDVESRNTGTITRREGCYHHHELYDWAAFTPNSNEKSHFSDSSINYQFRCLLLTWFRLLAFFRPPSLTHNSTHNNNNKKRSRRKHRHHTQQPPNPD